MIKVIIKAYKAMRVIFFTCVAFIFSASIFAKSSHDNVLFVGNSFSYYNNGIHLMTKLLVKGANKSVQGSTYKLITISAGRLSSHAKLLPNYFAANKREWDAIVLQEYSRGLFDKKSKAKFIDALTELKALSDKHQVQPYLFMTWASKLQPEMIKVLVEGYVQASDTLNIPVIPVGLAFDQVRAQFPELELYSRDIKSFENGEPVFYDNASHPSVAGTYLAACVIFSTFYQQSAEGNPFTSSLPKDVAVKLQRVAWQVVSRFNAKEHNKS